MPTKKQISPSPLVWGMFGLGGLLLYSQTSPPTGGQNLGQSGGQANNSTLGWNGFTPVKGYPGSLDESYLDTSAPHANLTTRYNNPMAVKFSEHNNWNGKILKAPGENRVFEKFISYPHGIRVGIYLLKYRYLGAGYDTIEKLIRRFAPLTDNGALRQNNYIAFVSEKLGVNRATTLNNDKPTIKKLVQAMSRLEGGQSKAGSPELVTDIQFETGWSIL